MREIKYRAWEHDRKIICYGYETYISDAEQNKYPLMQFTGLLDKNGKEIFEGDIIQFRYNDKCEELGYETVNAVVEFERGMFVCKEIGFDYEGKKELPMSLYEFMQGEEITIVGNIFENSELLKP